MALVGVNRYADDSPVPSMPAPDYSALAEAQRRRVAEARKQRDQGKVTRLLGELRDAAETVDEPLLPRIIEAVRARCTVGEISDVLRGVWGVYRAG